MLVAVMVIFVVCWTPSLLFDFSEAITKIFSQEAGTTYWIHLIGMWLNFLSMCNSCANVFIYYWASELVFFLIFQMQNLTILQHLISYYLPKVFHNFSQFRRAFQQQLRCFRRKYSKSGDVFNRSVSTARNRKRNCDHSFISVISTNINSSNSE